MSQHPKRNLSELKPAELRTIVGEIQKLPWQDELATDEQRSKGGVTKFWNADRIWSCVDLVPEISSVLDDHGLKPVDPPAVQDFDSVDQFLEALPEDMPLPDDYGDSDDPEDWTPRARPSS